MVHIRLMDRYTDTQKVSDTLRPMGAKYLKHILSYSGITKFNEISKFHSDIQDIFPIKK